MATYHHQVSFSCPGTNSDFQKMKEIQDFIGESAFTYAERIRRWTERTEAFERWKENQNPDCERINRINRVKMELVVPDRIVFDFNRVVPFNYIPKYVQNFNPDLPQERAWKDYNWGCNSNAIEAVFMLDEQLLMFKTIDGNAEYVLAALHRKFPEVTMRHNWVVREYCLSGGCDFLAFADWDECDITTRDAWLIERGFKENGKMLELDWEAGKPYNDWKIEF